MPEMEDDQQKTDTLSYRPKLDLSDPVGTMKYYCIFSITRYPRPFIEFLLHKDKDVLGFPTKKQKENQEEGVKEHGGNSFIFYRTQREDPPKNHRWVLIDEICNHRKFQNIPISKIVYNLFLENPSFIYLYKGEKKLEIPTVAYTGHDRKDNMTIALGAKNEMGKFGFYYYFRNYEKIKTATFLIRYALFLDQLLVNHISSGNERLIKRIEHPEGAWEGDSLYVGKIKLEDGNEYREHPLFVVKKFDQHVVLSWEKNI